MKVVVIYDKKGGTPVYSTVVPNEQVFIRELIIGSKKEDSTPFAMFPEDYQLFVSSDPISSGSFSDVIPFTSFLKKGDE